MRICLVGEFFGYPDEGMRNIAYYLRKELSKHHKILALNVRDMLQLRFWSEIRSFRPQIIHYIPGPSLRSFVIMRALSLSCKGSRTVMSATHPILSSLSKVFASFLRPDLVLTQCAEDEAAFARMGCGTTHLPSGVDTKKFAPLSPEVKATLREKYGLTKAGFIILHVGSIKAKRNLDIFKTIQDDDNQVLIIGSTSTGSERKICKELRKRGCIVWTQYFANIEEIYGLADCCVFPSTDKTASIRLPLSVLEAMACSLPVISTRFGALPRVFGEGDGLVFVDRGHEFLDKIQAIKQGKVNVRTREKVLPYSWQEVTRRLEEIYNEVIS